MFLQNTVIGALALLPLAKAQNQSWSPLTVYTHVNTDNGFGMVSSLIVGSQAAVLIDLPLVIPKAQELAAWIRNITDKPLVAAFSTHAHADHYLSGAALFEQFPDTVYYANSLAVEVIANDAPHIVRTLVILYASTYKH